jgi:hypothetical protein
LKPVTKSIRFINRSHCLQALQACALAIAVCFSVGATDAGSRFDYMSHHLMCQCGCAQLLGECDHLGCPSREPESAELRSDIEAAQTDQQIYDSFVLKYGAVVLAAPTTHGFDLVAWIAPFAVFAAALAGTILLVRRWTAGRSPDAAGPQLGLEKSPELARQADARLEQVRRDTGEGGF